MSDPEHDLRIWLQDELAARPHGTKGRLAKFLGVSADIITRMTNTDPSKETRSIKAHELFKLWQFFGQNSQSMAPALSDPDEIRKALDRIEGLNANNVTALLAVIQSFQQANAARPEQALPDDRSELAIPRRESSPSR